MLSKKDQIEMALQSVRLQFPELESAKMFMVNNPEKRSTVYMTVLMGTNKCNMNEVVAQFVGGRQHNVYEDVNRDNPNLRIVIEDINNLLE